MHPEINEFNNIDDVIALFEPTGEITPAGGICYEHNAIDMCAVIYYQGTLAKIFYNKKNEFKNREKWPCFYNNMIKIKKKKI